MPKVSTAHRIGLSIIFFPSLLHTRHPNAGIERLRSLGLHTLSRSLGVWETLDTPLLFRDINGTHRCVELGLKAALVCTVNSVGTGKGRAIAPEKVYMLEIHSV